MTGQVTIDLYKGGVYQKTLGTADAVSERTRGRSALTRRRDQLPGPHLAGRVSDDSDADFAIAHRRDDLVGTWTAKESTTGIRTPELG